MIGVFLSWYCTLRELQELQEVGLESCYNLSSRKWIMTSAFSTQHSAVGAGLLTGPLADNKGGRSSS